MSATTIISDISGYHGTIEVKMDREKFYWGLVDYDGVDWEEIPKYLYDALIKHEKECGGA